MLPGWDVWCMKGRSNTLRLKAFTLDVSHLKALTRPQKIPFSFSLFNFCSIYLDTLYKIKKKDRSNKKLLYISVNTFWWTCVPVERKLMGNNCFLEEKSLFFMDWSCYQTYFWQILQWYLIRVVSETILICIEMKSKHPKKQVTLETLIPNNFGLSTKI